MPNHITNRMTYEAFRVGYQNSEQAARAAFQSYEAALLQRDTLKAQMSAKIDLALDALNFDAGQWSDKSRERHLVEQIDLAKQHLRSHDQAALNAIKANAIMDHVNHIIGAYEAGFVDSPTLDLSQLYRVAQVHVKDGYGVDFPMLNEVWGEELAEALKGGEA